MEQFVKNPAFKDIPALKKIWVEAFGESETVLNVFFRNVYHPKNTLVIADQGTPVSMLYLLPCKWESFGESPFSGLYVYAVGTLPAYRGRGFAGALLKDAEQVAKRRNLDFLFLVPSGPSLFPFYEKQGYTEPVNAFSTTLSRSQLEAHSKSSVSPLKTGGSISYMDCRKAAFSELPAYIAYPESHLLFSSFLSRQYGRKILTFQEGQNTAFALLEPTSDGKTIVKEIAQKGIPFGPIAEVCLAAFPESSEFIFLHPKNQFPLGKEEENPFSLFHFLREELYGQPDPYVSIVLD